MLGWLLLATPLGCDGASPARQGGANAHSSASQAVHTTAVTSASAAAAPPDSAAAVAASAPAPSGAAALDEDALAGMTEPALFGPDGELLPQNKDEPSIDSKVFQERLANLFRAIQNNDPEMARSFFFPVQAYEKVKAIKKANEDWRWRLFKHFQRDVKKYHRRLGDDPKQAKLLRIQLRNKPRWMKPGKEGNRIGYYRVTRSWLHYQTAAGKERHFEITSMISWRGEWYVVHLHGFK